MVFIIDDLLYCVNFGSLRNWRNVILLAGIYYSTKLTLKTAGGLYSGFKTFCLPLVLARDYKIDYGPWAVVTGCSKGIGLCYAQELAKRGLNLVLIARKAELLNKIADELRSKHGVQVEVIIADFGKGPSVYKSIEEGLACKNIGILVNNVGVATDGLRYFHDASEETLWNMINVNIAAMTIMCKMILPRMEAQKKGAIINIASVASFAPQPFLTQYAATKAYVSFFSIGLYYEYSGKGITIQCLCPGPVATDMVSGILKGEEKTPISQFLIPNVNLYTTAAMRTLGFSSHTTGYWKHAMCYLMGQYTNPGVTFLANKFLHGKQKLEKEKNV